MNVEDAAPCQHDDSCPGRSTRHPGTCPCPHRTDCRMDCENCERLSDLADACHGWALADEALSAKSREAEALRALLVQVRDTLARAWPNEFRAALAGDGSGEGARRTAKGAASLPEAGAPSPSPAPEPFEEKP